MVERVMNEARAGRCICWIRNTVDDARHAFTALRSHLPEKSLALFHSRFAMGDRLAIEAAALDRFGKASTAAQRQGQVLIATQVVEQSLDLDFDIMISDLAPIDLLIQRAGRLQRHARHGDGEPATDGCERRPAPTLYLLCPENTDTPGSNWYAASFPKARHVYPNVGQLWLTQRALLAAGQIVSPGGPGEDGAVRSLVEAVYGPEADPIPDALQRATQEQMGKDMAAASQAHFNALNLERGYCADSSHHWYEDTQTPTRLGDETCEIYLAREEGGGLVPLLRRRRFRGSTPLCACVPAWRVCCPHAGRQGSARRSMRCAGITACLPIRPWCCHWCGKTGSGLAIANAMENPSGSNMTMCWGYEFEGGVEVVFHAPEAPRMRGTTQS
ncbi:CRISPR-associated helicase Cas3' (plasmid) [Ralstonia syzygii subsp. celebesensis]